MTPADLTLTGNGDPDDCTEVIKKSPNKCNYKPVSSFQTVTEASAGQKAVAVLCLYVIGYGMAVASSYVDWQNDTKNNKGKQGGLQNQPCQKLWGRRNVNVNCGGQRQITGLAGIFPTSK